MNRRNFIKFLTSVPILGCFGVEAENVENVEDSIFEYGIDAEEELDKILAKDIEYFHIQNKLDDYIQYNDLSYPHYVFYMVILSSCESRLNFSIKKHVIENKDDYFKILKVDNFYKFLDDDLNDIFDLDIEECVKKIAKEEYKNVANEYYSQEFEEDLLTFHGLDAEEEVSKMLAINAKLQNV